MNSQASLHLIFIRFGSTLQKSKLLTETVGSIKKEKIYMAKNSHTLSSSECKDGNGSNETHEHL